MTRSISAFTVLLFASLGLGCGSEGLTTKSTDGSATGGTLASGGARGFGGAGAGGTPLGRGGAGGSTALGKGGTGGANAGGSASGGHSGTGGFSGSTCPLVMCPAIACLDGMVPNPDPCGCPICASPDGGTGRDAADAKADARRDACLALPCVLPLCAIGYTIVDSDPCGCPTCVPVDAGQPDVARDSGVDTGKLDCAAMDECSCWQANGCASLVEACYCPYPTCGTGGACFCGGGRFVGCASTNLSTCAAAQARVSTLCPNLKGATYDGLCQQSPSVCITKCLNDVTACGDISCTACDTCGCAGDKFSACVASCQKTLKP